MFNWTDAIDTLHHISRKQVVQFLAGPDKGDIYGMGFFCDADEGVYLVANTEPCHQSSLRDFEARFGRTDSEVFRWAIGNWKYPGGLFASSSAEQQEFDRAWEECGDRLSCIETDDKQGMLEDVCIEVLTRLVDEGAFSTAPGLKGFTVLGPDDVQESVLEKKRRLDGLVRPAGPGACE